MTDKERLVKILTELDLPAGQWVLSGSGSMVMHGCRDHKPMGDVDIFCATRLWFDMMQQRQGLSSVSARRWGVYTTDPNDPKRRCDPPFLFRVMYDIEVNLFFEWRTRNVGDIDVNFWVHNPVMVEGVPCIPLQFLLDWKREVGRDKDVQDIQVLEHFLEGKTA